MNAFKKLEIITWPHPTLSKIAQPVKLCTPDITQLVHHMWTCMYESGGIGLAAPQVNQSLQIFVMDCQDRVTTPQALTFINPKIIDQSESIDSIEGCLSLPNVQVTVPRFQSIRVQAQDIKGELFEQSFVGLEAICIQHEMDHLLGKTFIDYLDDILKQEVLADYYQNNSIRSEHVS